MLWGLQGRTAMFGEGLTPPARSRAGHALVICTTATLNCLLHERASLMHRQ
jgi:hypothetical protein